MRTLLITTAGIEVGAGLVLLALPSIMGTFLFGSALSTPVELTIARMMGIALLALGVACWSARKDGHSRATRGLVGAMLVYNAGVIVVLGYAGIGLALSAWACGRRFFFMWS